MIVKMARHWGLMNAMSRRVGVDIGAAYIHERLDRSELRNAVFTCAKCDRVPDCERFLDQDETAAAGIPEYCLNRAVIAALRV